MKLEKFIRIGLIVSVIHLGIVFFSSLFSCSIAMDTINNQNHSLSLKAVYAAHLSDILSAPGSWVKNHYPDAQAVIIFLNSGLWGFGIAGIAMIIGKTKPDGVHPNSVPPKSQEPSILKNIEADHLPTNSPVSGNLVKRIWRGDIPLVRTFWFYSVFGNLILAWAGLLVVLQISSFSYHYILVYYAIAIALFIYGAFTITATWRSAGKYTGIKMWGTLARFGIIIGVVYNCGMFLRSSVKNSAFF